jgi:hypothetical protein
VTVSANELGALLTTDEGLDLRFVVHRERDYVALAVENLTALVRLRLDENATQSDIDRAVGDLGGRRDRPISLDNLVARALNRLRGRTNPTARSIYLVPRSLFPADAPPLATARSDPPPT